MWAAAEVVAKWVARIGAALINVRAACLACPERCHDAGLVASHPAPHLCLLLPRAPTRRLSRAHDTRMPTSTYSMVALTLQDPVVEVGGGGVVRSPSCPMGSSGPHGLNSQCCGGGGGAVQHAYRLLARPSHSSSWRPSYPTKPNHLAVLLHHQLIPPHPLTAASLHARRCAPNLRTSCAAMCPCCRRTACRPRPTRRAGGCPPSMQRCWRWQVRLWGLWKGGHGIQRTAQ